MMRTGSVACIPGHSFLAGFLHMGQGWRANPGQDHWQQHKPIQEAQHPHDGEHGKVVQPECVISAHKRKQIVRLGRENGW